MAAQGRDWLDDYEGNWGNLAYKPRDVREWARSHGPWERPFGTSGVHFFAMNGGTDRLQRDWWKVPVETREKFLGKLNPHGLNLMEPVKAVSAVMAVLVTLRESGVWNGPELKDPVNGRIQRPMRTRDWSEKERLEARLESEIMGKMREVLDFEYTVRDKPRLTSTEAAVTLATEMLGSSLTGPEKAVLEEEGLFCDFCSLENEMKGQRKVGLDQAVVGNLSECRCWSCIRCAVTAEPPGESDQLAEEEASVWYRNFRTTPMASGIRELREVENGKEEMSDNDLFCPRARDKFQDDSRAERVASGRGDLLGDFKPSDESNRRWRLGCAAPSFSVGTCRSHAGCRRRMRRIPHECLDAECGEWMKRDVELMVPVSAKPMCRMCLRLDFESNSQFVNQSLVMLSPDEREQGHVRKQREGHVDESGSRVRSPWVEQSDQQGLADAVPAVRLEIAESVKEEIWHGLAEVFGAKGRGIVATHLTTTASLAPAIEATRDRVNERSADAEAGMFREHLSTTSPETRELLLARGIANFDDAGRALEGGIDLNRPEEQGLVQRDQFLIPLEWVREWTLSGGTVVAVEEITRVCCETTLFIRECIWFMNDKKNSRVSAQTAAIRVGSRRKGIEKCKRCDKMGRYEKGRGGCECCATCVLSAKSTGGKGMEPENRLGCGCCPQCQGLFFHTGIVPVCGAVVSGGDCESLKLVHEAWYGEPEEDVGSVPTVSKRAMEKRNEEEGINREESWKRKVNIDWERRGDSDGKWNEEEAFRVEAFPPVSWVLKRMRAGVQGIVVGQGSENEVKETKEREERLQQLVTAVKAAKLPGTSLLVRLEENRPREMSSEEREQGHVVLTPESARVVLENQGIKLSDSAKRRKKEMNQELTLREALEIRGQPGSGKGEGVGEIGASPPRKGVLSLVESGMLRQYADDTLAPPPRFLVENLLRYGEVWTRWNSPVGAETPSAVKGRNSDGAESSDQGSPEHSGVSCRPSEEKEDSRSAWEDGDPRWEVGSQESEKQVPGLGEALFHFAEGPVIINQGNPPNGQQPPPVGDPGFFEPLRDWSMTELEMSMGERAGVWRDTRCVDKEGERPSVPVSFLLGGEISSLPTYSNDSAKRRSVTIATGRALEGSVSESGIAEMSLRAAEHLVNPACGTVVNQCFEIGDQVWAASLVVLHPQFPGVDDSLGFKFLTNDPEFIRDGGVRYQGDELMWKIMDQMPRIAYSTLRILARLPQLLVLRLVIWEMTSPWKWLHFGAVEEAKKKLRDLGEPYSTYEGSLESAVDIITRGALDAQWFEEITTMEEVRVMSVRFRSEPNLTNEQRRVLTPSEPERPLEIREGMERVGEQAVDVRTKYGWEIEKKQKRAVEARSLGKENWQDWGKNRDLEEGMEPLAS